MAWRSRRRASFRVMAPDLPQVVLIDAPQVNVGHHDAGHDDAVAADPQARPGTAAARPGLPPQTSPAVLAILPDFAPIPGLGQGTGRGGNALRVFLLELPQQGHGPAAVGRVELDIAPRRDRQPPCIRRNWWKSLRGDPKSSRRNQASGPPPGYYRVMVTRTLTLTPWLFRCSRPTRAL